MEGNKSQTNIPQATAAEWMERQDQLTNLGGGPDVEGGERPYGMTSCLGDRIEGSVPLTVEGSAKETTCGKRGMQWLLFCICSFLR